MFALHRLSVSHLSLAHRPLARVPSCSRFVFRCVTGWPGLEMHYVLLSHYEWTCLGPAEYFTSIFVNLDPWIVYDNETPGTVHNFFRKTGMA